MTKTRPPSTADDRNHGGLVDALRTLADEVRVLRESVDELREEVQYGVRNLLDFARNPQWARQDRSTPIDLGTSDFTDQSNKRREQDVPADITGGKVEREPPADVTEVVERRIYCCDQPKLEWCGDPDRPGIACAHCGFPVAHEGDILGWRATEEEEKPDTPEPSRRAGPPRSPQRKLF